MQIFHDLKDWQRVRCEINGKKIGFVPTMGNLHLGHASLFKKSAQDNELTVASLFINPTQFNQRADFVHYPRTLEQDLILLKETGVDICILPDEKAIYADDYRYQVQENQQSLLMEGKHRPGHFTGVLTVVMKLFNLVKPTRAYFGEKDYQQLQLIKNMVASFFMDIEIISCPTIREASRLAYSSRNSRLQPDEKKLAEQFATIFHQESSKEKSIQTLTDLGIEVEYIEDYQARRFAAIRIGKVRLIDNFALEAHHE